MSATPPHTLAWADWLSEVEKGLPLASPAMPFFHALSQHKPCVRHAPLHTQAWADWLSEAEKGPPSTSRLHHRKAHGLRKVAVLARWVLEGTLDTL